jgi:hypothetical protein
VIEGEEEIGSKNFVPFPEANKADLKTDFALVCNNGDPGGSVGEGFIPAGRGPDPRKDPQGFSRPCDVAPAWRLHAEFTDHSNVPAIALDWNMKPFAAAKRALTTNGARKRS